MQTLRQALISSFIPKLQLSKGSHQWNNIYRPEVDSCIYEKGILHKAEDKRSFEGEKDFLTNSMN